MSKGDSFLILFTFFLVFCVANAIIIFSPTPKTLGGNDFRYEELYLDVDKYISGVNQ